MNSVQPSHKVPILPDLNTVSVSHGMEITEGPHDVVINPTLTVMFLASPHNALERRIMGDVETLLSNQPEQAARKMDLFQLKDGSGMGTEPMSRTTRPGKEPLGVGFLEIGGHHHRRNRNKTVFGHGVYRLCFLERETSVSKEVSLLLTKLRL